MDLDSRWMVKMAWDLEEALFKRLSAVVLLVSPSNRQFNASSSFLQVTTVEFCRKTCPLFSLREMLVPVCSWGGTDESISKKSSL